MFSDALQLFISGLDRLPDVLIVLRVSFFIVQEHVEFMINASYPAMLSYLERASVGLHTMVDEHFGISVVEFMVCSHYYGSLHTNWLMLLIQAAGVIPVAHASAGPLLDIIVPVNGEPTGFYTVHVLCI